MLECSTVDAAIANAAVALPLLLPVSLVLLLLPMRTAAVDAVAAAALAAAADAAGVCQCASSPPNPSLSFFSGALTFQSGHLAPQGQHFFAGSAQSGGYNERMAPVMPMPSKPCSA